jgi:hypothetical protein
MEKDPVSHGSFTITFTPEGVDAIASAVVQKLRELAPRQAAAAAKGTPAPEVQDKGRGQKTKGQKATSRVFLNDHETVEYLADLGIPKSDRVLRNERRSGKGIPFIWVGGRARYRKVDIDAWVNSRRIQASTSDVQQG